MNQLLFVLLILPLSPQAICPAGKFLTAGVCLPCPPGTYQDTANRTHCDHCSAGTFSKQFALTSPSGCVDCPPNTYSLAGSTDCLPCSKGLLSPSGSASCSMCAPGSELRHDDCQPCSSGLFNAQFGSICKVCPPGTSSTRGSSDCQPCPAGTVPDPDGFYEKEELACRKCPSNMFAPEAGSDVCSICPPGMVAASDSASCVSCAAGTFRLLLSSSSCEACPPGSSSIGIRPAGCKSSTASCPVNTFPDPSGECTACLPGERFDPVGRRCAKCLRNQVSLGGASPICRSCAPGKRPADSRTLFENALCECEPGTVDDGKGGCKPCAAGSHWYIQQAGVPQIKYSRLTYYNEPRCELCEPGFFSAEPGAIECTKCARTEYTTVDDTTHCRPCPEGSIANCGHRACRCTFQVTGCDVGAVRAGDLCIHRSCPLEDQFLRGKACGRCWANSIVLDSRSTSFSTNGCERCPPNSVAPAGAATSCSPCPSTFVPSGGGPNGVGFCKCPEGFGEMNGVCSKCRAGEIAVDSKCVHCPSGTFASQDSRKSCLACSDMSLVNNVAGLLHCPDGTRVVPTLVGGSSCECLEES